MLTNRGQIPILIANIIALVFFTGKFLSQGNYEFIFYIIVIVSFLFLILATNRKVQYPNELLWGLTVWSIMHMSGGGLFIEGKKLYEMIILPLSDQYGILRFDQIVHIVGFFVGTLAIYHVAKPSIKKEALGKPSIAALFIVAGLGLGALNEIVEFSGTLLLNQTGVGGYTNNMLDLIADLIGTIFAIIYIKLT